MRGIVSGDVQGTGSPPSIVHSNVTPVSLEWNSKTARPLSCSMPGAEVMNVSGAVMSPDWNSYSTHCSSHARFGPRARTANRCSPAGTSVYVWLPELQSSSSSPSNQHQNVEPATSAAKVNVTVVSSVISAGAVRIVVTGGGWTIHS